MEDVEVTLRYVHQPTYLMYIFQCDISKNCLLLLEFGDNSLGTGWCHSCLTFATPWPVACEAPLHGILQAGILE